LWSSPWGWPPVGITAAAITGKWFGGVAAMAVLGVVATIGMLSFIGVTTSTLRVLRRVGQLLYRATKRSK
jgi:hypothetical protein